MFDNLDIAVPVSLSQMRHRCLMKSCIYGLRSASLRTPNRSMRNVPGCTRREERGVEQNSPPDEMEN